MNRRNLFKTMGVAAGSVLAARSAQAAEPGAAARPTMSVLIDTTRCVGCRTCERVCAEAHADSGITVDPSPDVSVLRNTTEKHWTVVNRFQTEKGDVFVKKQCMQCLQPACASACLTKAMHKTPEGAVAWDGGRCMGCRFCMVSCPFDVPKFEYFSANPRIQKCQMCFDRLKEGQKPVCVEHCPAEALTFGRRDEMLREAHRRIEAEPDTYIQQIYGEEEAGGTGVMYLASVPFEQLGFNTTLQKTSYPALTKEFLYGVPVVLALVPPFLVALNRASTTRNSEHTHKDKEGDA